MYSGDMTWANWVMTIQGCAGNLISDINAAKLAADKFNQATYGLTDQQILALPAFAGRTESDLTAMKYAIGCFTDFYNAMYGGAALNAVAREGYFTPFT